MLGVGWEFRLALVTRVDALEVLTGLVVRIPIGVFLPIVRSSWTIVTALMTAAVTGPRLLRIGRNQTVTDVTVSPDALPDLLVYEILSTAAARACESDPLLRVVVAGDDGGHLLIPLNDRFPLLAIGLFLGLGAPQGISGAFLASRVLAAGTFVASAKRCIAPVALSVDTHAGRLLDTEHVSLGRVPLARLDLQSKPRTQLLGALLVNL